MEGGEIIDVVELTNGGERQEEEEKDWFVIAWWWGRGFLCHW